MINTVVYFDQYSGATHYESAFQVSFCLRQDKKSLEDTSLRIKKCFFLPVLQSGRPALLRQPAFGSKLKKISFMPPFSSFLHRKLVKDCKKHEKVDFDLLLECAAPKRVSNYTTTTTNNAQAVPSPSLSIKIFLVCVGLLLA